MKLKCPACGAPIPASAINVQQMIAVCPECDNVFKFEGTFARQRRKLKAPVQFRIVDTDPDRFDMAFKWSFRTEPSFSIVAIVIALVVLLIVILAMIAEGAPPLATLFPLMPAAFLSYILLTIAVNSTHYESDGETLNVYTEPLPFFRYGRKSVAIEEVERVSVERPTNTTFPEGFYDVHVYMLDGERVNIAAGVNYEHAHFIAQEIESHLRELRQAPNHLLDDDSALDDLDSLHDSEIPQEISRKAFRS